jgi:hypothetical protein
MSSAARRPSAAALRAPAGLALAPLLVLLALVAFAAAPRAAVASADLETAVEDERILLDQPDRAPFAVASWAALGVQAVRIHARWWQIAPNRYATRRPSGFSPSDPDDRRYDWANLDRAIDLVTGAGLKVELTVTGPGPLWSSRAPRRHDPTWEPDPKAYAAFAHAVAARYKGRIARYLVWNEPNIPGWLSPQNTCTGARRARVCTPVSPHLYRGLVRAAVPQLHRADPGAKVLIGELAPIGDPLHTENSTVAPLRFLRAFACVDAAYRPIRTGRCRGFKPASADAFGHHPHGKRAAPTQASADPDWAKMGDLPRLERTLDRLTRAGRIRAPGRRLDIYLTEFGYQTSPPDHFSGITVAHQALWLQQAAYLAWRDPRVKSLTYYQWEDEPVRWRGLGSISYAGWQSGLLYVDGRPKPAFSGFRAPFVVARGKAGSGALAWGQVRPGGAHQVTIERRVGDAWRSVATVRTTADGFFTHPVTTRPGERFRITWPGDAPPDGPPVTERSGSAIVRSAATLGARLAAPED